MRLICPKCDAQYDIADDVIPPGGRDVQCSSCAHTWFQTDAPTVAGRPAGDDTEPAERPAPAADTPPRKPLDSSIADILREEAAREESVRAAETGEAAVVAAQAADDVNNEKADQAEATRRRIARVTGVEGHSPAAVAAASTGAVTASSGNMRAVPDIDEINATLRARVEANDTSGLTETEKQEVAKRRGFRRGFFFVLLLIGILIAPYVFAPQITENLPQTQGFMTSYVATVDQLRLWLNDQVQNVSAMIEGFTQTDPATETPSADQ